MASTRTHDQLLAAIVAATDDAIMSIDLDHRLSSWNPAAEAMFGYPAVDAIGRELAMLLPDDGGDDVRDLLADADVAGPEHVGHRTRRRRRDGTLIDVSISVSPLRDGAGATTGYCAIVKDATAQGQHEQEIVALFAEVQAHRRHLEALAEVQLELISSAGLGPTLQAVAERARTLTDADGATVALLGSDGNLQVAATAGTGIGFDGRALPPGSLSGQPVFSGAAGAIDDIGLLAPLRRDDAISQPGPTIGVPLVGADGASTGALWVFRDRGRPVFSSTAQAMVESFAGQAELAVELALARQLRDRIRALEANERVAAELHDTVIQRLFAAGIGLQAQLSATTDPAVIDRLGRAISLIDDSIVSLREAIFGLRDEPFPG